VSGESRVEGSKLDVGVDDSSIGMSSLDILWQASTSVATTTSDTRLGGISISRKVAVEPL
jgi:hypothetical protein